MLMGIFLLDGQIWDKGGCLSSVQSYRMANVTHVANGPAAE